MCIGGAAGGCLGAGAEICESCAADFVVGDAGEGELEFVNRLLTSNLGFVSGFDAGVPGVDGAGVEAAVDEVEADDEGGLPLTPFAFGRPGWAADAGVVVAEGWSR